MEEVVLTYLFIHFSVIFFFLPPKGLKDKKEIAGNHTMVTDKTVCILNLNMSCNPAVLFCFGLLFKIYISMYKKLLVAYSMVF